MLPTFEPLSEMHINVSVLPCIRPHGLKSVISTTASSNKLLSLVNSSGCTGPSLAFGRPVENLPNCGRALGKFWPFCRPWSFKFVTRPPENARQSTLTDWFPMYRVRQPSNQQGINRPLSHIQTNIKTYNLSLHQTIPTMYSVVPLSSSPSLSVALRPPRTLQTPARYRP